MAIEIEERFSVHAPIDAVWRFLMDPEQVVSCMPGASLDEVVDDRNFLGSVQVKLGAVTTSYKGRVKFTETDEQAHVVEMLAEARETGGGTLRATLSSRLTELSDGETEIVAAANVNLTGRIVQVGRGMIQGVSHQIFQQFAAATKERLEQAPGSAPVVPSEPQELRLIPIVLQTLWSAITRFVRRLLGRPLKER
ncbi:MAG: SRPBCC family protein [Deltaproteobacteria bacterium]|nr:SRPBCC family protein [Deltaproteobacteria bacterium]MBW2418360.1 SRPBCC family protein [Deltaproteobacteria bacterium]